MREEGEESDQKRKACQAEYECTFAKMSEDDKRPFDAVEKCNKARHANSDLLRHPIEGRAEQLKDSFHEEVIDMFEACILLLQNIPRKTSDYIAQLER
ncbi:hypothetical protein BGZ59_008821 [Podila verticillata]|nr:hypothetical protein BGZ59_008821 [Podila verticillata]